MISLLLIITIVVIALPFILVYAYASYCVQAIGRATGHGEGWKAWVPIANLFYICELAGKPGWWVLLLFLPIVNFVFLILIWMDIARALAKPVWSGVLVAFPLVQWPAVGYLAGLRKKTIITAMAALILSVVAIPLWGRVMSSAEVRTRLALADLQDRDRNVRVHAMYELQAIPAEPSRVVPALTGLLGEQDPHVRQNAIEALGRMGPSARDAIPALVGMLKDNSLLEIFRLDVVESLRKIAPDDEIVAQAMIEFCVKVARHETRDDVSRAIRNLGKIGARTNAVVPALVAALSAKDIYVRQTAAEALGGIGPAARDAIPALMPCRRLSSL